MLGSVWQRQERARATRESDAFSFVFLATSQLAKQVRMTHIGAMIPSEGRAVSDNATLEIPFVACTRFARPCEPPLTSIPVWFSLVPAPTANSNSHKQSTQTLLCDAKSTRRAVESAQNRTRAGYVSAVGAEGVLRHSMCRGQCTHHPQTSTQHPVNTKARTGQEIEKV